jgi:hypothetical protein
MCWRSTEAQLLQKNEEIAAIKLQLRKVQERAVDEWMYDGGSDALF